jgi:hypothetical protein
MKREGPGRGKDGARVQLRVIWPGQRPMSQGERRARAAGRWLVLDVSPSQGHIIPPSPKLTNSSACPLAAPSGRGLGEGWWEMRPLLLLCLCLPLLGQAYAKGAVRRSYFRPVHRQVW